MPLCGAQVTGLCVWQWPSVTAALWCHSLPAGPEAAVRAGSAVAALLLWELLQQLLRLKPIADAFRAADTRCQGVLALPQFLHFCRRLNQAMSDDEVQVLFYEELQGGREQVTFTDICRALLPAL